MNRTGKTHIKLRLRLLVKTKLALQLCKTAMFTILLLSNSNIMQTPKQVVLNLPQKRYRIYKVVLTLHLVTIGGLSCLRRGEAGAVAQEARLSRGLGLAQTPLRLYACPQWT